jgi:hypothetical protein
VGDRIVALAEITLAIAQAIAAEKPGFVEAVGTNLRETLMEFADQPEAFDATIQWMDRLENATAK